MIKIRIKTLPKKLLNMAEKREKNWQQNSKHCFSRKKEKKNKNKGL